MHLLHPMLSTLSFIFALYFSSKVLRERRAPGSIAAWLLVMILFPYIGVPLYLLIGGRKIKRLTAQKGDLFLEQPILKPSPDLSPTDCILLASGVPPSTSQNRVTPQWSGEDAFVEITRSLHEAKTSIHLATFILGNDPVGHGILDLLCTKAKEGVQVRLLIDGLGSFGFPSTRLSRLKEAGGRVSFFLPLFKPLFVGHSNLRNHRKLLLIDGQKAILGGRNLTQLDMGPTPDPKRWTDFSFSIFGEAAQDLEKLFASDWNFTTGESLKIPAAIPASGEPNPLRMIPSGPDVPTDPLYDILLTEITSARKRIWIATPYFIPDEALAHALELACRRGLDVRILLPARSNHRLADLCRASYLKQIDASGGQICFFQPGMMHAKLLLIDDGFGLIGSANLDMRSLLLNFEMSVLLSSPASIQMTENWFLSNFTLSVGHHPKDSFTSSVIEGFGRVLGPML